MARKDRLAKMGEHFESIASEYDVKSMSWIADQLFDGEHRSLTPLQAQFAGSLSHEIIHRLSTGD